MKIKTEMIELVNQLNKYIDAYEQGEPLISDKEWDELYFKLKEMESETGVSLPYSPTQSIHYPNVVTKLNKVTHNHPMLSLDKTKDIKVIKSFFNNKEYIAMPKLDGLTCSLLYLDGGLARAETRGNGVEGEDITHNILANPSVPNHINTNEKEFIIDGEIICSYETFKNFESDYTNPRSFASGSARLLNSIESKNRGIIFIAWDVIKGFDKINTLEERLTKLQDFFGFNVVTHLSGKDIETIESKIENIKELNNSIPIDGIVFKYNNVEEYEACGRTDHHFKGGIAYKFYDEVYPTKLKDISWTMGRTGVLTPVAIFEPIVIDGTTVERASLHNVSIMKKLLGNCAYVGEPLEIYKANQIIPQVYSAGPKYDFDAVIAAGGAPANDKIKECPICGGEVEYKNDFCYCINPNCSGKIINRLDHYCGKKGLDIKGLSKKTLEKLIDFGWLNELEDIYKLKDHREEWIKQSGFGQKSVDNILNAIEESRKVTLSKLISAIGVNNISVTASIVLGDYFKTWDNFIKAVNLGFDFTHLPHFGVIADYDLNNYDYSEIDNIVKKYLIFEEKKESAAAVEQSLTGLVFCITGKVNHFKNRDELKDYIKQKGGKVTNSISAKTNYLITNDTTTNTQKNKKAKELGVSIISETELLDM